MMAHPPPQSARQSVNFEGQSRLAIHPVEQVENYIDARQVHLELLGERADKPGATQRLRRVKRLAAAVALDHAGGSEQLFKLPDCQLALAHPAQHAERIAANQRS